MISYQDEDEVLQRWQASGSRFGVLLPETHQPCLHNIVSACSSFPQTRARDFNAV